MNKNCFIKVLILRRQLITILRHYRPFSFKRTNSEYIYVSEPFMKHSGLFDKLKGIISIYALSKVYNIPYKIHFISPFILTKYLVPNDYNWVPENVHFNYPSSHFYIVNNIFLKPLWKKMKGENHFDLTYDVVDNINKRFGTSFDWGILYNELFKPSELLQSYLDNYSKIIGKEYIAIHFRMVNLLGDNTEPNPDFKCLPEQEKIKLIEDCIELIDNLKIKHNKKIVIFTDSNIFSNFISTSHSDYYIVPGTIKHIGNNKKIEDQDAIKVFVDYYLISKADCVISVIGRGLYKSAFPAYAAKIGHRPFERIILNESN